MPRISSQSGDNTQKIVAPCATCGSEVFPLPNVPVPRWVDLTEDRPAVLGLNCVVTPFWTWCARVEFFTALLAKDLLPSGLPGTPFPKGSK